MKKTEFLNQLRSRLQHMPLQEQNQTIAYYDEMISDRMEDGVDEDGAVAAMGSLDQIARESYEGLGYGPLLQANLHMNQTKSNENLLLILVLILTSPIWLLFFFVILALFIAVVSTIFGLMVGFLGLVFGLGIGALGALAGGVYAFTQGSIASGVFLLGGALLMFGVTLLLIPVIPSVVRGTINLVKNLSKVGKKPLADRIGGTYEK